MSKTRIAYVCSKCSHQTIKWLGCCPECKEWDTFSQQEIYKKQAFNSSLSAQSIPLSLTDLSSLELKPSLRMTSDISEWDRVTGGGIVPGAFIVLTGDPGIGKSTLLLQMAYTLSKKHKLFYFSSEESLEQVKLRADRISCISSQLLFSDNADLEDIITTAKELKPDLIVIDSIQNCTKKESDLLPGSINQLKEAAFALMRLAKDHKIAVIVSSHITKDGVMAGPKTLEHMVDAVFYLQGEDRWQTRVLRSVKNRFGTVNELGFFSMGERGLEEVPNINKQLLAEILPTPGSLLISYIEGTRPLLIELQALTIQSKFGMAQRVVSGIDQTQVVIIAAILEKYLQIPFSAQDIFFKISGSFKIKGNGSDLGIALALLSSYFQKPLPEKTLALGEISLTGAIKPINQINIHLKEAAQFGIKKIYTSRNQRADSSSVELHGLTNIYDLLVLFGD